MRFGVWPSDNHGLGHRQKRVQFYQNIPMLIEDTMRAILRKVDMITSEQIQKAIAAHGLWKDRLKKTIETGISEFSQQQVQADNVCEFGKWLYSLPGEDMQKGIWKEVQFAHAQFHKEAARILELALKRSKDEALAALDVTSNYRKLTGKLAILLNRWAE
jgi:methyl-accepting chemotaxis protein